MLALPQLFRAIMISILFRVFSHALPVFCLILLCFNELLLTHVTLDAGVQANDSTSLYIMLCSRQV